MGDIISFIQFCIDNDIEIGLGCILFSIILSAGIMLHEHKEKLWKRITHRRNKFYFAALIIYATGIGALCYWEKISAGWLYALIVVFILYCVLCCLALKPLPRCTHWILKRYQKFLDQGLAIENIPFFEEESHWFLSDADEHIEYQLLRASYFSAIYNDVAAYKALCSIKGDYLYEEEKQYINMRKAMHLSLLGSMSTALHLLGKTEDNTSENPMIWITYSYIYEQSGDIDSAFKYAKKAKDLLALTEVSKTQKAAVFNDYARYALMHDNEDECLRYNELAFEEAKSSNNTHCLNVITSNLVARTAISGNIDNCKRIFDEYRVNIKVPSIDNVLEYNNSLINYYRQTGDDKEVFNLIKNGYNESIGKFKCQQRELFKASTFRMLMSGCYRHEWFDGEVSPSMDIYMQLPLPERLQIFKEYIGVFFQTQFRPIRHIEPYATLFKNIMSYYQNEAIQEIDDYLKTIESYEILKYYSVVLHKLSILKLVQGKEHIAKSRELYLNLYKTMLDEGRQFDAANVLMTLIDECSSPCNVLIHTPFWQNPMYLSDYIEQSPMSVPHEASDGIHLEYTGLVVPPQYAIHPLQIEEMRKHIDELIRLYNIWQNHPAKIDFSIAIASTLMRLNRRDEAKPFLEFFKKSKLSSAHFAHWFRNDLAELEMEFANE